MLHNNLTVRSGCGLNYNQRRPSICTSSMLPPALSRLAAVCARRLPSRPGSLKQTYPQCYGRYGFCDALHPAVNWYDPDVLGIDLGIGLLMSENLRSGFVWETCSRNPEVGIAFRRAGFRSV